MTNKRKNVTGVARLIARRIEDLAPERSQADLARQIGFKRANMLSMIKRGEADVPFGRLPAIAKVLNIEPALLLRVYLKEQWPAAGDIVDELIGGVMTPWERGWLKLLSEFDLGEPPVDPQKRHILKMLLKEHEKGDVW